MSRVIAFPVKPAPGDLWQSGTVPPTRLTEAELIAAAIARRELTLDTLNKSEISAAIGTGELVGDQRLLEWWNFYAGLAGAIGADGKLDEKLRARFSDVRDLLLELIGRRAKERL